MRIGVVTLSGSLYGLRVLNALQRLGHRVALVVAVQNGLARKLRLLRRVVRKIGWGDALWYALEYQYAGLLEQRITEWRDGPLVRDYAVLAEGVVYTASLSTPAVEQVLEQAQLDILLLGQSGVVPATLLSLPRYGTLNAHPGMLPHYRGIDCYRWAILDKQFSGVGSSLHLVDHRIDTGAVLLRRPYQWTEQEKISTLPHSLYEDCIDLLLEGVRLRETGDWQAQPQTGGCYYHKMPRRLLAQVNTNLQEFLSNADWTKAASDTR